jgi:hypothetical protein
MDLIEDLDTNWIEEFNKMDEEFKNYYCEDLSFIKVHYVYINSSNEINITKEEKLLLKSPSVLSKEELLHIIKDNCFINNQKYSLLGILKYNINIEPLNLKHLLKYKNCQNNVPFLTSVKNIDTIKFEKSITMFHDINEIFILFHELICIPKNINIESNNKYNYTKKVYINSNTNKRTKRKRYKELTI